MSKEMKDLKRFNRCLDILLTLQAEKSTIYTVQELAEKYGTSTRTIFRDISELQDVVQLDSNGYKQGYRFVGNFHMYPLNFSEEEYQALMLLKHQTERTGMPKACEQAFRKVIASHQKDRKLNIDAVERVASAIRMGKPIYTPVQEHNWLPLILQAVTECRSIRAVYFTPSKRTEQERKIDPYYLIPRDEQFYVVGFCHLRGEVRTFRVSRFSHVEKTDDPPFDKSHFSIEQYYANTWSIEKGTQHIPFKVRFSREVATYIQELELFVEPVLTELPNGDLLFEVTLNSDREFLQWLKQFGPNAELLEPSNYREAIREQLLSWIKIYETS